MKASELRIEVGPCWSEEVEEMAYCRWSSEDFGCDLYVYEDVMGGFTVHVAGNRVVGEVPRLGDLGGDPDEVMRSYRAQMDFLKGAERKPIGLACDGQTFRLATGAEAAAKVRELVAMGYRCPEGVAEQLEEESDE